MTKDEVSKAIIDARREFETLNGNPPNVCRVSGTVARALTPIFGEPQLFNAGIVGRGWGMDIIEDPTQDEAITCEFVRGGQ